jgi:hypothetical protein
VRQGLICSHALDPGFHKLLPARSFLRKNVAIKLGFEAELANHLLGQWTFVVYVYEVTLLIPNLMAAVCQKTVLPPNVKPSLLEIFSCASMLSLPFALAHYGLEFGRALASHTHLQLLKFLILKPLRYLLILGHRFHRHPHRDQTCCMTPVTKPPLASAVVTRLGLKKIRPKCDFI